MKEQAHHLAHYLADAQQDDNDCASQHGQGRRLMSMMQHHSRTNQMPEHWNTNTMQLDPLTLHTVSLATESNPIRHAHMNLVIALSHTYQHCFIHN
jgi:hypothetical protein